MNHPLRFLLAVVLVGTTAFFLTSFKSNSPVQSAVTTAFKMPWKAAGLTERQAAAHLIDRFSFGNKPGMLDEVVSKGLENWFAEQLNGTLNDDAVNERLKEYDALRMSNEQIINAFPRNGKVLKQAIEDGVIAKDSVDKGNKELYKDKLQAYMEQKGYRPQKELDRQFINHKILTAIYSNNQLHQVLTDFWFNHFNVSATKNDCAPFIPVYERDVILPHVTGKFNDLLLATAQSPAMLFYLDNFNSSGTNGAMEAQLQKRKQRVEKAKKDAMEVDEDEKNKMMEQLVKRKKEQGLNENYAREIMELHTLGVDGGYTQADVTEAARVLTGWTVYPYEGLGGQLGFARKLIDKFGEENLAARGFVHKGDFLFAMNRHDDKEKKVLGRTFAAGGGYAEGVELISMLAHHPSTAKFIARKLAVRFVSDAPPQSLIDKMATAFTKNDGDITAILITMVSAPEFWKKDVLREKTKSPFELTISAVRALNAEVDAPFMLNKWIGNMGQKIYFYQAPTGFPDRAQYWINTGSLLNRMKFGLALAAQKIPGIHFNLTALNDNHEPESAAVALKTYGGIILPERDLAETVKRLEPMINDPSFIQKVDKAVTNNNTANNANSMNPDEKLVDAQSMDEERPAKNGKKKEKGKNAPLPLLEGNNTMLAQVVGIILGSPEFQRR